MKKSKAIIILLCALLVLLGVGYVDLYGVDAEGTASASDISLGLDLAGGVSITYQVVGDEEPDATDMADTIAKLQKRVENYSKEAIVYQEGTDRINIEIPGVTDANKILEELGRPGSLYFIAETDKDGNANYSMQAVTDAQGNVSYAYALNKTIDELKADGSIMLEGTDVKTATAGSIKDQTMGNSTYAVDLVMTEEGTKKFEEATRNAYEKGETLGIYYDGSFVSVPSVKGVFSDGNAQISPMNSYEEAESLASTIRIGGLKLELEELHSKVVGAQLGVEAISTSLKAAVIGFIVVAVFMIAVYFLPGFASVIALGIYVALVVLLLNGFDITLTLSGIAGIILSIGMAVDANVIVFARIREELATGKTVKSAMQIGYDKALSAIIDGNVTTLIAAAVLWLLGPGTVKGFAQTLALGIVLSMFTALVVTKYIMKAFYALGLKDTKWYGIGKEHKPINFLGKKGIFFGLSLAVILVGFITMGVYKVNSGDALNYSLEFKGGTATTVTFDKSYTLEEINSEMVPLIESTTGSAVQIQTVQGSNEVIFKTTSLDVDQRQALNQVFVDNFGVDETLITSETISSTISNEMKSDTILAVAVAIICMLIYIRFRFSDIRFGVSSIACLLHDVLVVITFYALARVSVSNTFIACLLTIVGYSINATIVIFDRVRENMAVMTKKDDLQDVVNHSITQTLSRSLFTSLTTLVMVGALYIWGVTSIRDFALPLMVGIICGAYSSVCIAGALWYVLRKKFAPKAK
ncbi:MULTISPECIES: protein translocase subunit SecD [Waltera]|jgi:SecD/SecF fusion protein|uniref:Multifunctional fusion protein n=4 Tax=Waltera TaxID=2815781 RepID=A0AAE3A1S1_9FIRM|nr:protein translocase subunit SecD [Brotolimicola acetigignens]MCC2118510.1 protein translocase subunit SecD [Brotolimicola acetigignens]SCH30057.1 bifunctional preprotein translocase subunit SecD/SecF [uncultured Clostridium sp.]